MKKDRLMKWAAKALALVLAGSAVLGGAALPTMSVAAAGNTIVDNTAPGTGTLTIKKKDDKGQPLADAVFSLYKVMSLTPGTQAGDFASFEKVTAYEEALKGVNPDELGNYSSAELESLIGALAGVAESQTKDATITTTANSAGTTSGDLALGYYLVVETETPEGYVKGNPFLVAIPSTNNYDKEQTAGTEWVYDVTVEPKNTKVSIEKKLADGGETYVQDGSVKVGDYVKYEVTSTIPSFPDEYYEPGNTAVFKIEDTMSDGLEIQNTTSYPVEIKVKNVVPTLGSDYKLKADPVEGNAADLVIDFTTDYLKEHKGDPVVVTYYAKVTERAVSGTEGNSNGVVLKYSNGPGSTTQTEKKEVKVYTFNIKIKKFTTAGGTETPLQGAEFELYADKELKKKIGAAKKTEADGTLTFAGLDEGTYYLKETKSPAGYTLLTNPIEVTITAEQDPVTQKANGKFTLKINGRDVTGTTGEFESYRDVPGGTAVVAVENYKGFSLPATGGMGIALFVLVGITGIAVLSVVITRKTKKNE